MDTSLLFQVIVCSILVLLFTPIVHMIVIYLLEFDGPFEVFRQLRLVAGVQEITVNVPEGGTQTAYKSNGRFLADILTCPYCLTPYISTCILASLPLIYSFGWRLIFWLPIMMFSVSGLNILLVEINE